MVAYAMQLLSLAAATLARAARAAVEEVDLVRPAKIIAEAAGGILPHQTFSRTRTVLLRAAGVRIGEHSLVLGPVHLSGDGNPCRFLRVGKNTIITGPLRADLGAPVEIGDRVRIGHDVMLLTIDHDIGYPHLRSGTTRYAGITIGDGAWLASRVTVLPGVNIGAGSIVAGGAVVKHDVPPHTMVAGVPARVVRTLNPDGPGVVP